MAAKALGTLCVCHMAVRLKSIVLCVCECVCVKETEKEHSIPTSDLPYTIEQSHQLFSLQQCPFLLLPKKMNPLPTPYNVPGQQCKVLSEKNKLPHKPSGICWFPKNTKIRFVIFWNIRSNNTSTYSTQLGLHKGIVQCFFLDKI